jgi:hypothetical protein
LEKLENLLLKLAELLPLFSVESVLTFCNEFTSSDKTDVKVEIETVFQMINGCELLSSYLTFYYESKPLQADTMDAETVEEESGNDQPAADQQPMQVAEEYTSTINNVPMQDEEDSKEGRAELDINEEVKEEANEENDNFDEDELTEVGEINVTDQNKSFLLKVCKAVTNICGVDSLMHKCFLSANITGPLAALLIYFKEDPDATFEITGAIWKCARNNDIQLAFGKLGCCKSLYECLGFYAAWSSMTPSSADKQEAAEDETPKSMKDRLLQRICWCIINLSISSINQIRFGRLGLCKLLSLKLSDYLENSWMVREIVWAIRNTSTEEKNQLLFCQAGACDLLAKVLHVHVKDAEVMVQVCGAISNLSCIKENIPIFLQQNTCRYLIDALTQHISDESTIYEIFWTISNFTTDLESKNYFQKM